MATNIGGIEVLFKEANRDFSKRWCQFGPSKETLPKGWQKAEGRRALDEDLIFERDMGISLRDGVTIWADVFRPVTSDNQPVPAIFAWSPYGKQGNGTSLRIAFCSSACTKPLHQAFRASTGSPGAPGFPEIGPVTSKNSRLWIRRNGVPGDMRLSMWIPVASSILTETCTCWERK